MYMYMAYVTQCTVVDNTCQTNPLELLMCLLCFSSLCVFPHWYPTVHVKCNCCVPYCDIVDNSYNAFKFLYIMLLLFYAHQMIVIACSFHLLVPLAQLAVHSNGKT
jgi:hypothetical protein